MRGSDTLKQINRSLALVLGLFLALADVLVGGDAELVQYLGLQLDA
jgi:hypothetical protein